MQNYIIAARTAQGLEEWSHSPEAERCRVLNRWHELHPEIQRQKNHFRHGHIRSPVEKAASIKKAQVDHPFARKHRQPKERAQPHLDAEYESAIKASVQATSKGDASQDDLIEQAIRASVRELQTASSHEEESETTYHRDIQASVAEAQRNQAGAGSEDKMLEEALRRSLLDHSGAGDQSASDAPATLGGEDHITKEYRAKQRALDQEYQAALARAKAGKA